MNLGSNANNKLQKYVQFLMEPSFERIIKTKENPSVPHTMEFE